MTNPNHKTMTPHEKTVAEDWEYKRDQSQQQNQITQYVQME